MGKPSFCRRSPHISSHILIFGFRGADRERRVKLQWAYIAEIQETLIDAIVVCSYSGQNATPVRRKPGLKVLFVGAWHPLGCR